MHEDNSAVLRQKLALELTIKPRLCPDYTGADHTSIVQVRQQVHYKRTLLQLENRLHATARHPRARIESQRTGIDLYFGSSRGQALRRPRELVRGGAPPRQQAAPKPGRHEQHDQRRLPHAG